MPQFIRVRRRTMDAPSICIFPALAILLGLVCGNGQAMDPSSSDTTSVPDTTVPGDTGGGSVPDTTVDPPGGAELEVLASATRRWTGVTVSPSGRLFVNFPRWSADVPVSVAEVVDRSLVPFPDGYRNAWVPGGDAQEQFVCVQSVVADGEGYLWVLDPASPNLAGVVPGGPKLMRFNLATAELEQTYRYAPPVIAQDSYLNDVRVDLEAGFAYITDSGNGAIVVTELATGVSRRVLDDHPSTHAEDEVAITIDGSLWPGPPIHADGIALSPDRSSLYFKALTGHTLYRIETAALRDKSLDPESLGQRVESLGPTAVSDGLLFGADGLLYITAIESNAIMRYDPSVQLLELVVQHEDIKWPDTLARDPEGRIVFTTSQIHLGQQVADPFYVFRIK